MQDPLLRRGRPEPDPAAPPRGGDGGTHQPELLGSVVGHDHQVAAGRTADVVDPVLDPRAARLDQHRRRVGLLGGQQPHLRGVPAVQLNENQLTAAATPDRQPEAEVVLLDDEHVGVRRAAQPVPPQLVRPVGLVVHHVEEGGGVGAPRTAVVGAGELVNAINPGGQVAEAQGVDLVPRTVQGVGEQPPVRADLAHTEADEAPGRGAVVEVEQGLGGTLARGAAEPLVLLSFRSQREVREGASAPARRALSRRGAPGHLGEELALQRPGSRRLDVVVSPLGLQVGARLRRSAVTQPGVVVDHPVAVQVADGPSYGCHRRLPGRHLHRPRGSRALGRIHRRDASA